MSSGTREEQNQRKAGGVVQGQKREDIDYFQPGETNDLLNTYRAFHTDNWQ